MESFTGFCISLKQFADNQAIADIIHTKGRTKGLIKNLYSKSKKRNILDVGNYVKFTWYGKENSLGIIAINSTIKNFGLECSLSKNQVKLFNKIIKQINLTDHLNFETENLTIQTLTAIANNSDLACVYSLKLQQEILRLCGHGLNIEKCVKTGNEVKFISPITGHGVSEEVGLPFKKKLFSITSILSLDLSELNTARPSSEDINKTEEILDYFFKKLVDN